MSEVPQTAAGSWREVAEWLERSLAEGDQSLRFLPPVLRFVSAHECAGKFWAHPLKGGLAMSLSPELEGAPYLVVWSDDDWPCYDIELRDRSDRPLVGWSCDGEEELESALTEAIGRLQALGPASPAAPPVPPGRPRE
jgi:hypothetical protein